MSDDYPTPTTQRVRIIAGPWPERIGCEGVLCNSPKSGCYPQTSKGDVIVLLDDDPIKRGVVVGVDHSVADRYWSCHIDGADVEYLGG